MKALTSGSQLLAPTSIRRLVALLIGLMVSLTAVIDAQLANAGLVSRQSRTLTVSVGAWAAVVFANGGSPTNLPYQLDWKFPAPPLVHDYFTIQNTGKFTIQTLTILFTTTGNPNAVTLARCNGTWNTATHTCSNSNGIETLVKATDQSVVLNNLALATGGQIILRASTNNSGKNNVNPSVSVSVARNGIRPASTLNS